MADRHEMVDRLLDGVALDDPNYRQRLAWHPGWGFMYEPDQSDEEWVRLAGYAAPYLPGGADPVPNTQGRVSPVADFDRLPRLLQNVDHASKGVGLRVYTNTGAARSGSDLRTSDVGLYAFELNISRIVDRRRTQGSVARQYARQAGLLALEKVTGPKWVVDNVIHPSYGAAEAVLLHVPPRSERAQRRNGLYAAGVPNEMLIIRESYVDLRRMGQRYRQ